jgi:hypothetical protein
MQFCKDLGNVKVLTKLAQKREYGRGEGARIEKHNT